MMARSRELLASDLGDVMRWAVVALLVGILYAPSPVRAAPSVSDALRGCVEPDKTPDGWVVRCEGALIGIADGPGDGRCSSSECAQRYIADFQRILGGNPKRVEQEISLGGAPRRLVQSDGLVQRSRVRLLIAVIARPEGHRFLNCFGNPAYEKWCRPAFDAMATLPWRPDMPKLGATQPVGGAVAPQTVGDGLRGCALLQKTPDGWMAGCQTSTVVIIQDPPAGTCRSDECAARYATGFAKNLGENQKRAEKTIKIAGVKKRVLQLDGMAPSGPGRPDHAVRALVAVLDREEGPRVLMCLGPLEDEARCRSAFDAMADLPWRADVPVPLARSR
jgi:hypothetical protein